MDECRQNFDEFDLDTQIAAINSVDLPPKVVFNKGKKKLRWLFHFKFSIFTCSLASEFIQEKFSHNVKTGENEISKPFFLPEWNVVSPVCPRGPEVCDNSKRRSLCRHRRQHHSALSGWFPPSSASSPSSWSYPHQARCLGCGIVVSNILCTCTIVGLNWSLTRSRPLDF